MYPKVKKPYKSDVPGLHARLVIDYKILGPVFKMIWKRKPDLIIKNDFLNHFSFVLFSTNWWIPFNTHINFPFLNGVARA